MSERERMLVRLGRMLEQIARPHSCNESLPTEVQAGLWQLGLPCTELTPREEIIAGLWARKRSLLTAIGPEWGGPGLTPPSAA
ncbi:MAG TPA: hypothetical protein VLK30_02100 [Candidatus Limnocylindrales bacterium]|nr:hypothetical protein [Candidatus Limnocylindrales bacterium]